MEIIEQMTDLRYDLETLEIHAFKYIRKQRTSLITFKTDTSPVYLRCKQKS